MDDLLEEEYREPYETWNKDRSPAANAAALTTFRPIIEGAVKTHVGAPNPLIMSQARLMTLDGLRSYDRRRGRLAHHIYGQLAGLKRVNRKQTTILKVPERIAIGRKSLSDAEQELAHVLGRDPTDTELADHTGFSSKAIGRIRSYNSGISEGFASHVGGGQIMGAVQTKPESARELTPWQSIVYAELDPHHQKVMEYTLGLHGRKPLQNHQIAAKLNRSPGAISQAKKRIQQLLDEEFELSPFS